jgi:hypothetical protein
MRKHLRVGAAIVALALLAAGCGGDDAADEPSGTAAEIADEVFAEAGVEPFGEPVSLVTDEDLEFYLGSANYPEFIDSAVVLPLINVDTRALYILKTVDEDQAAEVMEQLEEDVDPNRLICVSFAPEDVVIDSRGGVVFMTINSDEAQRTALAEAFTVIE